MQMYKPRTVRQIKLLEHLKERYDLEAFIVSPISRNGLMLEDQSGEQTAFLWTRDGVAECPVPMPSGTSTRNYFEACFQMLCPEPQKQTFDARTAAWLNAPYLVTYQQALNLTGPLFRHYLTHPMLSEEEVRRIAKEGAVSQESFYSIVLWYLNGNQAEHYLDVAGIEGDAPCFDLILHCHHDSAEHLQFYLTG